MLERIAIGVLTCKLWNLWLSVLPRLTKQPEQWSESVRPLCSLLTFCDVTHQGHCAWKTLRVHWSAGLIFLPLFCFVTVVTWASWCTPRTAHRPCLQLAYLFFHFYETDPRSSLSIFNVSLAQWFLAGSCNHGLWGVVIHERIQLS